MPASFPLAQQQPGARAKSQTTLPTPQLPNIADVVARTNGGVVNIQSVSEDGGTSIGSGFCLDAKGEIVTNFHVIRDALKIGGPILAVTQDGRILTASVRGYDEATDLALLEVDLGRQPLPTLPLGDSDAVRVGDWVIAIGSPFELDHTVTVGIISGKGRSGLDGAYDDFLQTDAAINFGNSGGPLVALTGEVIGINTLVLARGQGLGFAIPVNILKELLPDLRSIGRVRRSSIGVEAVDISALDRRGTGLAGAVRGVRVAKVERGLPGDQAGLRRGDIVVAVEGTPVMSSGHFNRLIARSRPGTAIQIRIRREEKEYTVAATPIEKK
ncbi:S1C family serine protease [Chloracidobacterium aggregatum]|uniref:Trypsin-like peptidase domain-containing protein n=1 Tax=Chloracidobacterium sp. N TaxID=2821540 RepID=A0ABX8B3R7_9BACT|nr:trypsin-like peptidase domain-containing protein [Chloracidobacterium aggregatum]QUV91571.1 trypsin-like peptidase domain-containing protein [Chloracidobacterium sp. A]QUV94747.1 trypsin-like peptidase domain-containing protein [Chloracidobacterium sp. N]QUV95855.1 trypsin-like peptidase domain-containing protein [Chloracidobacterium sp. E]